MTAFNYTGSMMTQTFTPKVTFSQELLAAEEEHFESQLGI
jgi:hypothetical protein